MDDIKKLERRNKIMGFYVFLSKKNVADGDERLREQWERGHELGKIQESCDDWIRRQYHELLAGYMLVENVPEIQEAKQAVIEKFGSIDQRLLAEEMETWRQCADNCVKQWGGVEDIIKDVADKKRTPPRRGWEPPLSHSY